MKRIISHFSQRLHCSTGKWQPVNVTKGVTFTRSILTSAIFKFASLLNLKIDQLSLSISYFRSHIANDTKSLLRWSQSRKWYSVEQCFSRFYYIVLTYSDLFPIMYISHYKVWLRGIYLNHRALRVYCCYLCASLIFEFMINNPAFATNMCQLSLFLHCCYSHSRICCLAFGIVDPLVAINNSDN